MQKIKIVSVILCLAIAAAASGCGKIADNEPTDSAVPSQSVTVSSDDAMRAKNGLEEMTRLDEAKKNQMLASNQAELDKALADKTSSGALFRTTEHTSVTVTGENAGKTVTVNAPSGSVVSQSENVSFVLESTGTGGLITDAKAASIYVKGESIPLTLKAGAETVLVYGKDCTVTFKGGEYPSVAVYNTTAVLTNLTSADITVTLANGATVTIPSMQTYSLADDVFSKAKA